MPRGKKPFTGDLLYVTIRVWLLVETGTKPLALSRSLNSSISQLIPKALFASSVDSARLSCRKKGPDRG